MLDGLGRVVGRHPGGVVVAWAIAVLLAAGLALGVLGQGLFDRLSSGILTVPGESQVGLEKIVATTDTGPVVLLVLDEVVPTDPAVDRAIDAARADIARIPGVLQVSDPYVEPDGLYDEDSLPYVAADFDAVLVSVDLRRGLSGSQQEGAIAAVSARLERVAADVPGSRGLVGGVEQIVDEVTEQVEVDLRTGEGIALPVSLLVMVVVFGGFLAAGLPIVGAIASIAGALGSLLAFSYAIDLDASTVNVVTVLGLGLCIDYGLLIVSRYREELRRRLPDGGPLEPAVREAALRRTMATAGRTVMFSGVTVGIALTGLLCFRADILRAIGAAGVSVVAVALLVALTLVPALMVLAGGRMVRPGVVARLPLLGPVVRRLGDVAPEEGHFSRLARLVQRAPAFVIVGVLAVLFVLALPVSRMHLVGSGVALLPVENEQRQLFDTLDTRFTFAATPLVQVVAEATPEQVAPLAREIAVLPTVTSVEPPRQQGDDDRGRITVINVRVAGSESATPTLRLVEDIRSLEAPYPTYVTGPSASLLDFTTDLRERAPLAAGVVVLATLVLLFLMTGSVLIPVKALLMNVVSLGASLGVLVWGFQEGALEGVLGFRSAGGLETLIPPLTLAFGFGLAMDYEVFLLSRIAEYRRRGMSNDDAVVHGLQKSGRIITSAALIVVVVFSGFVAGELLVIKETGVALAVAVAIDATLIRMLLVPATMTLLKEWNWWAPGPLRRLHDRFGLREHDDVPDPEPEPERAAVGAS